MITNGDVYPAAASLTHCEPEYPILAINIHATREAQRVSIKSCLHRKLEMSYEDADIVAYKIIYFCETHAMPIYQFSDVPFVVLGLVDRCIAV